VGAGAQREDLDLDVRPFCELDEVLYLPSQHVRTSVRGGTASREVEDRARLARERPCDALIN
jgi:hypothetical protein